LRVIGAGDELRRSDLDEIWPDRPVRVQHRSGALWTLNSAALGRLRRGPAAEELATGQFWRAGDRLRALLDLHEDVDLSEISAELSAYGITHVTDATPDAEPSSLTVDQHVLSLAGGGTGPRKIVLADHRPPDLDGLVAAIRNAHDAGRGVALHAVSRVALAVALAALTQTGSTPADRIEHAAVCDDDSARRIAELGVAVVTQPSLVARHGRRYLTDSEPDDRPLLWRYAGLLDLDVRVAVSSDAPYGDPCPWVTVAAASRRERDGAVVGPEERVEPGVAFASMLSDPADPAGAPRSVRVGASADLCLLAADLATVLDRAVAGETVLVRATLVGGRLAFAS
jgi:predicted amidohydrolase YtcJ